MGREWWILSGGLLAVLTLAGCARSDAGPTASPVTWPVTLIADPAEDGLISLTRSGKAAQCLPTRWYLGIVCDGDTIDFISEDGDYFRNHLPTRCIGAIPGTRVFGSYKVQRLCDGHKVIGGSTIASDGVARCLLGPFVPYRVDTKGEDPA
jgi:hypothetical protein